MQCHYILLISNARKTIFIIDGDCKYQCWYSHSLHLSSILMHLSSCRQKQVLSDFITNQNENN